MQPELEAEYEPHGLEESCQIDRSGQEVHDVAVAHTLLLGVLCIFPHILHLSMMALVAEGNELSVVSLQSRQLVLHI